MKKYYLGEMLLIIDRYSLNVNTYRAGLKPLYADVAIVRLGKPQ